MRRYPGKSLKSRCAHAIAVLDTYWQHIPADILRGLEYCMEHEDGGRVVQAVMAHAAQNPQFDLKLRQSRHVDYSLWQKTASAATLEVS